MSTSYRTTHGFPRDAELLSQRSEGFTVRVPATALQHDHFRQLMVSMSFASVRSAVPNPIYSLILFWRSVAEVFRPPVIQPSSRPVQTLLTFRARSSEGQQYELVDAWISPSTCLSKNNCIVTVSVDERVQKMSGKVPDYDTARPGATVCDIAIEAPHTSSVAHVVQALVAGYRQPALGGRISHSRSVLPVRFGRCVASRGRTASKSLAVLDCVLAL